MVQYLSRKEQVLTGLHCLVPPITVTMASGNLRIAWQMDPYRPEQMKKYSTESRGRLPLTYPLPVSSISAPFVFSPALN